VIWLDPTKFLMDNMTWPRPYQGQFVVRRLWLAHSTTTSNLNFCNHQLRRCIRQRKMWKLRWFNVVRGVTQGHRQHNHSTERIRQLPIWIYLSCTVFEILSLIFQKLKRSRDSDHAPFRDNLSSGRLGLNWTFLASSHGCGTIKLNLSILAFTRWVGHFERKF